ncbi:MAG TPA: MFS transporter [Phycisphaerales bacterium]|nr:MFS transporter [Phycisphaerales bacterium]
MAERDGLFARVISRVVVVKPAELPLLLAAFGSAFFVFTAYMMLRPVRDAIGAGDLEKLDELLWATFIAMLVVQPIYGWLTSRYRRTAFLPWVYGFFCLNLIAFWAWFHFTRDDQHALPGRVYFVWVSVFNLFVVAVFWSLMADIFSREQAGRMFGFIASGLSCGGIVGPLLGGSLAKPIGSFNLLLLAAAFVALSLGCMLVLLSLHRRVAASDLSISAANERDRDAALGGSMWSGFAAVATSPYLIAIAAFVLLLTWVSTFLWLEQAAFVKEAFATRDERTAFFSKVDFVVQAASLVLQMLIFSRLFKRFGFASLIISIPLLMLAGFTTIALAPTFAMVVGLMAVRRVGEYGITRPCRDILWTSVPREQKYKAKAIIDTFVYRGGDATASSLHAALQLGTAGTAWLGAGTAAVWCVIAWWLGRRNTATKQNAA